MNQCQICGTKERELVRDHNHSTGFIRGFLCQLCNSWLGAFEKTSGVIDRERIHTLSSGIIRYTEWVSKYAEAIRLHLSSNTGVKFIPA
jgi:Recombination endonuclease VII